MRQFRERRLTHTPRKNAACIQVDGAGTSAINGSARYPTHPRRNMCAGEDLMYSISLEGNTLRRADGELVGSISKRAII